MLFLLFLQHLLLQRSTNLHYGQTSRPLLWTLHWNASSWTVNVVPVVFESNSMETKTFQPTRTIIAMIISSSSNNNSNNVGENVCRWQVGGWCWRRSVRVPDCSELRGWWGGCWSGCIVVLVASEGDGVACSLERVEVSHGGEAIKTWVSVSAAWKNVWVKWLLPDWREGTGSTMAIPFAVGKSSTLLIS